MEARMINARVFWFVLCLLSFLCHASFAQGTSGGDDARQLALSASGPSSNSAGPAGANTASVNASNDKTTASSQLKGDHIFGDYLAIGNLMAEAPINNAQNNNMDLGSVSALTAGVNERLAFWAVKFPPGQSDTESDERLGICDDFLEAVFGAEGRDYYKFKLSGKDKKTSCQDLAKHAKGALPDLLKVMNSERKKAGLPPLQLLSRWLDYADVASLQFAGIAPAVKKLDYFGLSVASNQHNYSYVTTAAPTKIAKENTLGYGATLSWMRILQNMSFILGYSYERPFKGGMGEQVCKPIGTSTSTTCSAAMVGAPTRTLANIVSAEFRAIILKDFAMAPRVEYDITGHNIGAKLPLYLRTVTTKSFSGGVEVGWTRDAHFQGALVLTKAFSFYD
jgi:hypothetical protein